MLLAEILLTKNILELDRFDKMLKDFRGIRGAGVRAAAVTNSLLPKQYKSFQPNFPRPFIHFPVSIN